MVAGLFLVSPALARSLGYEVTLTDYLIAFVFGWFMWSAATSAITSARIRSRLPALQAKTLARRALAVDESVPLSEAIRQAQEARAGAIVTLNLAGDPIGVVSEAAFVEVVTEASRSAGRRACVLRYLGAAPDHPVALDFPEGRYLKGLMLQVD